MTELKEAKEIKTEDIKKAADEKKCPVSRSIYYLEEFLKGPMCGKCHPCALGSYEALVRVKRISEGNGGPADVSAVRRIADEMLLASRCIKGKDTAKFMLEWLAAGDFNEHLERRCSGAECSAFLEYRIDNSKCTMCGDCLDACRYKAIFGEKRKPFRAGYLPYEIRQKKCTKCGDCVPACKEGAISIVFAGEEKPAGV